MTTSDTISFRLRRPSSPLPTAVDFYSGPNTEAAFAWERFGGKSLSEAYDFFMEAPEIWGEDFAWMFPKAFEYYFPVVDKYLREIDEDGDLVSCSDDAWIFGCRIASQFHWKDGTKPPTYVVDEIADLSSFIKTQYRDEREVMDSWSKVDREVDNCR